MKREQILKFLNKKVKLVLSNDYNYTGTILKIREYNLVLKDKFDLELDIDISSIFVIGEVKDGS